MPNYSQEMNSLHAEFPLTYAKIATGQENDNALQAQWTRLTSLQKKDYKHNNKTYRLITRDNKIMLPANVASEAIAWYHSTVFFYIQVKPEWNSPWASTTTGPTCGKT